MSPQKSKTDTNPEVDSKLKSSDTTQPKRTGPPMIPITVQPQTTVLLPQRMGPPNTMPINCPPGLQYLLAVDQLLIQQKVEILETITGFETNNQYLIRNSMGQDVYLASEDTDCCTRNCCGPNQPFDLRLIDHTQREIIHIYRPLRCDSCCCPFCLHYVEVEAPPGIIIGYAVQDWSCFYPCYHIENSAGDSVLRIEGPICTYQSEF